METMTISRFFGKVMPKYFPTVSPQRIEKTVMEFLEERNERLIHKSFYVPKSILNLIELNTEHYFEIDNEHEKFQKNFKNAKVYVAELVKPDLKPYELRRDEGNYATLEFQCFLVVYDTETDQIIGYLEGRETINGLNDAMNYLSKPFVGFIRTNDGFQNKGVGSFMLRAISFYYFLTKRKDFFSGTSLSQDMRTLYHTKRDKVNWMTRADHLNDYTGELQERYKIEPPKLNILVTDAGEELLF